MLCDSLEGWNGGGGRDAQMGGDICIFMADSCFLQWKPTQHYKAIILQLKINFKKKAVCGGVGSTTSLSCLLPLFSWCSFCQWGVGNRTVVGF